jgi:hypothetical protein
MSADSDMVELVAENRALRNLLAEVQPLIKVAGVSFHDMMLARKRIDAALSRARSTKETNSE